MKGMQNKNNAQDIKDVYVRQYRALHHYFIFDCFVGFGQGFVFSIAFRHETNLSCCTVFGLRRSGIKMKLDLHDVPD
jgi:hypothetical protein